MCLAVWVTFWSTCLNVTILSALYRCLNKITLVHRIGTSIYCVMLFKDRGFRSQCPLKGWGQKRAEEPQWRWSLIFTLDETWTFSNIQVLSMRCTWPVNRNFYISIIVKTSGWSTTVLHHTSSRSSLLLNFSHFPRCIHDGPSFAPKKKDIWQCSIPIRLVCLAATPSTKRNRTLG